MKQYLLIILAATSMCAVASVGSSDAIEIKKECAYLQLPSAPCIDAPARAAFIYDAVVPASIVMPEMKLRYREFTDFNNSFEGRLISMIRDRSPPKSEHLI